MKKIRNNPYFWIWILTSFLWGILNIRYILGEYACFYTDIGGDTFHINYPLYCLFSEVFQGKGFDSYFLNKLLKVTVGNPDIAPCDTSGQFIVQSSLTSYFYHIST